MGAINLNNMIPIPTEKLIKVDLKQDDNDSVADVAYKKLLRNQLTWCNVRQNKTMIIQKVEKLY